MSERDGSKRSCADTEEVSDKRSRSAGSEVDAVAGPSGVTTKGADHLEQDTDPGVLPFPVPFASIDNTHDADLQRTDFEWSEEALEWLFKLTGKRSFRDGQLPAINASLLKNDCFVVMQTGLGKSLIFQIPALVSQGVTLVVAPLRSLIEDQVRKLERLGIPVFRIAGKQSPLYLEDIYKELSYDRPNVHLVYITPEALSSSKRLYPCLQKLYDRKRLVRLVVDEVHCVSQWGHDFRPMLLQLRVFRKKFPLTPIMAVTATAPLAVRADVSAVLGLRNIKWFQQTHNRRNIRLEVRKKDSRVVSKVVAFLRDKAYAKQSGILYCASCDKTEEVAKQLVEQRILAAAYHAGMSDKDRQSVHERWSSGAILVVCATTAFGMGIDKADVRFVIHLDMPSSVEGYYQEFGRAGRDGLPAVSIVFYALNDFTIYLGEGEHSCEESGAPNMGASQVRKAVAMARFVANDSVCRRIQCLDYLGERLDSAGCNDDGPCGCDNCQDKSEVARVDVGNEMRYILQFVEVLAKLPTKPLWTALQIVELLRGVTNQAHKKHECHRFAGFACLSGYKDVHVERLVLHLLHDGYLSLIGKRANPEHRLNFYICVSPKGATLIAKTTHQPFHIDTRHVAPEPQQRPFPTTRPAARKACLEELREFTRRVARTVHRSPIAASVYSDQFLVNCVNKVPLRYKDLTKSPFFFPPEPRDESQENELLQIVALYSRLLKGRK